MIRCMHTILSIINWIRRREIVVLLAVLVAVLGTWAFIMLADAVKEKGTQNIDERIIIALRRPENRAIPIGPPWLHEVGRDMTALGGVGHTLPFLIPEFHAALTAAMIVVLVELGIISWIRHRYMESPWISATLQVVLGGILVFLAGVVIGQS